MRAAKFILVGCVVGPMAAALYSAEVQSVIGFRAYIAFIYLALLGAFYLFGLLGTDRSRNIGYDLKSVTISCLIGLLSVSSAFAIYAIATPKAGGSLSALVLLLLAVPVLTAAHLGYATRRKQSAKN